MEKFELIKLLEKNKTEVINLETRIHSNNFSNQEKDSLL